MKKTFAAAVLSLVTLVGGIAPAHAFPSVVAPVKVEASRDVQQVQYHRYGDRWDRGRYRDRRDYRDYRRRGPSPGAIIGGLAAGAIIGGALAAPRYEERRYIDEPRYVAPRRYVGGGSAHVSWCYNRYRSYRSYDNTFQPYNGPRQQCYSPYS